MRLATSTVASAVSIVIVSGMGVLLTLSSMDRCLASVGAHTRERSIPRVAAPVLLGQARRILVLDPEASPGSRNPSLHPVSDNRLFDRLVQTKSFKMRTKCDECKSITSCRIKLMV